MKAAGKRLLDSNAVRVQEIRKKAIGVSVGFADEASNGKARSIAGVDRVGRSFCLEVCHHRT
jgi:hypothetical protein